MFAFDGITVYYSGFHFSSHSAYVHKKSLCKKEREKESEREKGDSKSER